MNRIILFFSILTLFSFNNLFAQTKKDTTKMQSLEEVVITASSHVPKKISEIPGTVWVIDSEELQTQVQAGSSLKEVLGILIPSLDFGGQGRTNYAQNMRGRNVLVMINGVSLNSARNVSRQFDAIDPFNIARVEVVSGASAVYGGGATGGIINIVTKKSQSNELSFETSIGLKTGFHADDLDKRIAQSIAGGTGDFKYRVGAAFTHNDGAYDANGDPVIIDVKQADFQYNRSFDVLGSFGYEISQDQKLSLDLHYYNSKVRNEKWLSFGEDFIGLTTKDPEFIKVMGGVHSDVVPRTERMMANLQYNLQEILGGQDLILQVYARTEKTAFGASFTEIPSPPAGVNLPIFLSAAMSTTSVYGLKAVLYKKWEAFSLAYGVDIYNDVLSDAEQAIFDPEKSAVTGGLVNETEAVVGRYPHTNILGVSGFAQANWDLTDQLSLSTGLRQQFTRVKIDDFTGFKEQVFMHFGYGTSADVIEGGQNDYSVTLVNAKALYKFNERNQLWFGFSQGFEVPDAAKSYGYGQYELVNDHWNLVNTIDISQEPLSGIKTNQYELGWRTGVAGFHAQGALFYALSSKTLKVDKSSFTISLLDQKLRNYGLEIALGYSFENGFELGGNALLMKSETETKTGWENQLAYFNNPSKFTAFLGYNADMFSVRLQMQHSMDYTDFADLSIEGYTLFDLMGSVQLFNGTVNFGVKNLLNEQYTTIWGQRSALFYGAPRKAFAYQGRGRTFSVGYTIKY